MSEMKHTRGPWEVKEVPTQSGRAFRIGKGAMLEPGPKGCCIIYDDYYGCDANERKANAHLISAAPDMYEALRKCQKALAMMVTPGSIEQTSVVHAFAVATEAEVAARSALQKAAPPEIQS